VSSTNHNNAPQNAPGFRAIRWNMDWITRPLFGLALATIAVGVLFSAPLYFACLVVAISIPASLEWHRMVAGRIWTLGTIVTVLVVAASVAALMFRGDIWLALLLTLLGAGVTGMMSLKRAHPLWHSFGVLYLTLPNLALVALRTFAQGNASALGLTEGALVIIGLFLIVWTTDSGALVCGNLIGGPRMSPRLSPGKTWAGTIGGSVVAALVFGFYIRSIGGANFAAGLFAFFFSAVAHGGDLFESFVKRRFGVKNSGALIPGHGGFLDRMDSTITASIVLALLIFVAGFDPLFGAHP